MKKLDFRELKAKLGRFKYPLLILLLGLVLLSIPARSEKKETAKTAQGPPEPLRAGWEDVEARMEAILGEIEGAGKVRVMLQYSAGEKSVYQTDSEQEIRTNGDGKETRTTVETVLASGGSGGAGPVVVQTIYPTFRGAVVVAEGADAGSVKLDLVNAVSSLTGLGADKITVIKMKSE